jgi:hypothetical protein
MILYEGNFLNLQVHLHGSEWVWSGHDLNFPLPTGSLFPGHGLRTNHRPP